MAPRDATTAAAGFLQIGAGVMYNIDDVHDHLRSLYRHGMVFTDSNGVEWLVTEISDPALRSIPTERLRMPEFKSGWLLFQSQHIKKRLAPYPDDWRAMEPAELERLLAKAKPAPTTIRPSLTGEFPRLER